MRSARVARPLGLLLAVALATGGAFLLAMALPLDFAEALSGAIYTTTKDGTAVNANIYGLSTDVYLSGGPQNLNAAGLPDGRYFFQITDPSGNVLLSTDNASCRQLEVVNHRVSGFSGASGTCHHNNGTFNPANGTLPVQMAPFSPTPNNGLEYKAWLIAQTPSTSISATDPKVIVFKQSDSKTDNFKVQRAAAVPPGSCQPSSSLAVLVQGTTVTAYVPKANWQTSATGVAVVGVENSSTSTVISTGTDAVNSCASNPLTGTTVCTANNADVLLLSGTTLTTTLTSSGSGIISFSGGSCTNCGVAMDATHNKAVIGLSLSGTPGFQFLNLATNTFETAFASMAPSSVGFGGISEDPLIDPIRNFLLSPTELGDYQIVNVATTTSPTFAQNMVGGVLDSAGEDCSTGIALAPLEFSGPSLVYIADLTQATFTFGSPGTWTEPAGSGSQFQTLSESVLSAGASGVAVAQGTHTGVVTGEFGGNNVTAIALPATSGSGIPAIADWVTCVMSATFSSGLDPHTVTAYQSPTSGHAIALVANFPATTLARVDLTNMLNPAIVSRTAGGHGCAAGTLPSSVVSFITVP